MLLDTSRSTNFISQMTNQFPGHCLGHGSITNDLLFCTSLPGIDLFSSVTAAGENVRPLLIGALFRL